MLLSRDPAGLRPYLDPKQPTFSGFYGVSVDLEKPLVPKCRKRLNTPLQCIERQLQ